MGYQNREFFERDHQQKKPSSQDFMQLRFPEQQEETRNAVMHTLRKGGDVMMMGGCNTVYFGHVWLSLYWSPARDHC